MENLDIHAGETDLERARRLLSEPANHQEGVYLANALLDELKMRREQPEDAQTEILKRLKQLQDIDNLPHGMTGSFSTFGVGNFLRIREQEPKFSLFFFNRGGECFRWGGNLETFELIEMFDRCLFTCPICELKFCRSEMTARPDGVNGPSTCPGCAGK